MAVELRFRQVLEGQQAQADMKKSARELGEQARETEKHFRDLQKATGATGEELQRAKTAAEQAAGAYKKAQSDVRSLTEEMQRLRNEAKQASEPFKNISTGANLFNSISRVTQGNLSGIGSEISNLGKLSGGGIFTPLAAGATIAVTALASVGMAVGKLTLDEASLVKEQQNNANLTGLTLKQYGVWSQVASNAGANINALLESVRTLSKGLAENSEEGKKAKLGLDQLFGSAEAAKKATSGSTEETLKALANAFGRLESPMHKADLAFQILGRPGIENLKLLNSQLEENLKHVEDLGVGFDNLNSKNLKSLDKSMQDLDSHWTVLKQTISETAAPWLDSFVSSINQDLRDSAAIVAAITAVYDVAAKLPKKLRDLATKTPEERADQDAKEKQEQRFAAFLEDRKQAEAEAKASKEKAQYRQSADQIQALRDRPASFGTPEQRQLEDLQKKLATAKQDFERAAGAGLAGPAKEAKDRVDKLEAQIDGVKKATAAAKELAAAWKKVKESRAEALDARNTKDGDIDAPFYKIAADRDKQIRELSPAFPADKRAEMADTISGTADIQTATLREKRQSEMKDELRKHLEQQKKEQDERIKKQRDEDFKRLDKEEVEQTEEGLHVYDVGYESRRKRLIEDASHQQRLTDIQNGGKSGESATTAAKTFERELELAQKLRAEDELHYAQIMKAYNDSTVAEERIKLKKDAEIAGAKTLADIEEASAKAKAQYQERTLELIEKQKEAANQLGQELFTAATSRSGFRQFYQNLGQRTATTIAGNVLEAPLRSVTQGLGTLGEGSGFAPFLKNTLFDPKNANDPRKMMNAELLKNSTALADSTKATADLSATIKPTLGTNGENPSATSPSAAPLATGPAAPVFDKIPGWKQFTGLFSLFSGHPGAVSPGQTPGGVNARPSGSLLNPSQPFGPRSNTPLVPAAPGLQAIAQPVAPVVPAAPAVARPSQDSLAGSNRGNDLEISRNSDALDNLTASVNTLTSVLTGQNVPGSIPGVNVGTPSSPAASRSIVSLITGGAFGGQKPQGLIPQARGGDGAFASPFDADNPFASTAGRPQAETKTLLDALLPRLDQPTVPRADSRNQQSALPAAPSPSDTRKILDVVDQRAKSTGSSSALPPRPQGQIPVTQFRSSLPSYASEASDASGNVRSALQASLFDPDTGAPKIPLKGPAPLSPDTMQVLDYVAAQNSSLPVRPPGLMNEGSGEFSAAALAPIGNFYSPSFGSATPYQGGQLSPVLPVNYSAAGSPDLSFPLFDQPRSSGFLLDPGDAYAGPYGGSFPFSSPGGSQQPSADYFGAPASDLSFPLFDQPRNSGFLLNPADSGSEPYGGMFSVSGEDSGDNGGLSRPEISPAAAPADMSAPITSAPIPGGSTAAAFRDTSLPIVQSSMAGGPGAPVNKDAQMSAVFANMKAFGQSLGGKMSPLSIQSLWGQPVDVNTNGGVGDAANWQTQNGAQVAGSAVGTAGTLLAGAFGVKAGIQKGGIKGYSGAVASAAGTIAQLDPDPVSASVLGAIALTASLVSAFGPDPYKARQDQITRTMRQDQYFAPQAMSDVRDLYGNHLGYNYKGTLGQVGQTTENQVIGWNSNYTQPVYGNLPTSPGSAPTKQAAPPAAAPVAGSGTAYGGTHGTPLIGNLNVTAFDSKSIVDYHPQIAEAVYQATLAGNQRLQSAVLKNAGLQ